MPHAVFVFSTMPDVEYLSRKVDAGALRSASLLHFGPYAAVAMASTETMSGLFDARSDVCLPGINCDDGLLIPLPVPPNVHRPQEVNVLAFLSIAPGNQQAWEDLATRALAEEPEGSDTTAAAAAVLGIEHLNGLVSVSGPSARTVNDRLHTLIDTPLVRTARTAVIGEHGAAGWGSDLARLA